MGKNVHLGWDEEEVVILALEKLRDDPKYAPIVSHKCCDILRKLKVQSL